MAIAFMPSDEDTEARYERLNRLLMELYDVLCHIMAARTIRQQTSSLSTSSTSSASPSASSSSCNATLDAEHHHRSTLNRVRPSSDSSAPRPRLPDLVLPAASSPGLSPRRRRRSARTPPASPSCARFCFPWSTNQSPFDDEVFLPPPTPPLHRHRRRRRRSVSLKDSKRKSIKCNKIDDAIEAIDWNPDDTVTSFEDSIESVDKETADSLTSSTEEKVAEPENSILSSLLSTSLGGSLWTAVVLVVGWKLFSIKR